MKLCDRIARAICSRYRRYKSFLFMYLLTFFIILPSIFFWSPNSPYYKLNYLTTKEQRLEMYKKLNDIRKNKAYDQLSHLVTTDPRSSHLKQNWPVNKTRVLITLLTTPRPPVSISNNYRPQYLTQTAARLLDIVASVPDSSPIRTHLLLCDVAKSAHREAENLNKLMNSVHHHSRFLGVHDEYEVAKRDYVLCLNDSLRSRPDYVLIVEDDALAHFDLLRHLEHLTQERIPSMKDNEFGFIKLYHPNWLNGYITADVARLAELFSVSLLLFCFFAYILYGRLRKLFDIHLYKVSFLLYLYCILCLLAIGRINVNYIRRLSPHLHSLVPAPSCCTPANLYSARSAQLMVDYLSKEKCYKGYAIDSVMDKFTKSTGMTNWLYEPKLFNHIGVFSTRHHVILDPSIVD